MFPLTSLAAASAMAASARVRGGARPDSVRRRPALPGMARVRLTLASDPAAMPGWAAANAAAAAAVGPAHSMTHM